MEYEKSYPEVITYIRDKINQLLEVMGTIPLKPEELDDKTLIQLDPIGIIANSFKQILKHHENTNKELELARNEIRSIFDSINASVLVIDQDRRIRDFNPNAKHIFFPDIEREDILDQYADDACGCNMGFLDDLLVHPKQTYQLLKDDRNFIVNVSLIGDIEQAQYLAIVHLYDITEQKKIESELNQHRNHLEFLVRQRTNDYKKARDEAEKANKAKSEFLSSMSHELRTPLNAILGFSQLLEFSNSLNSEEQENVQEIIKAGKHLLMLINEVLDLAKIESGRIDLSLDTIEIEPLIKECLTLMSSIAENNNIKLSYTVEYDAIVRADRTRLKQALLNLLSNAIKYNSQGGSVKLDISPVEDQRLRIRVTDTGKGIPSDQLEQLFQPFNRLEAENSDIEGTGIGLTLTRRIIELMGGNVNVESEVGVGSTFWIELPIESLNAIDKGQQETEAFPEQSKVANQNKVLYVEDNPANIRLVAGILGRHQHIHLITAHTPELGIELAKQNLPDLILLDINLPGGNGYQVLEALKSVEALNKVPVFAITSDALPQDIERGKAAGFDAYLTKPLDVKKFLKEVDHFLYDNK